MFGFVLAILAGGLGLLLVGYDAFAPETGLPAQIKFGAAFLIPFFVVLLLYEGLAFWWYLKFGRRWYIPRSLRHPTLALQRGTRPPILFLRSFTFDEISKKIGGALSGDPGKLFTNATAEQYTILQLSRLWGPYDLTPVLAIGRPDEFSPPFGASRFYVRQDRWQDIIRAASPLCSLVIWTVGHTPSLHWEISYLVKNVEPARLVLWLHAVQAQHLDWAFFCNTYRGVFPKPLPRELGGAQYIGFDDQWTPHLIPSGHKAGVFSGNWKTPLQAFLRDQNVLR